MFQTEVFNQDQLLALLANPPKDTLFKVKVYHDDLERLSGKFDTVMADATYLFILDDDPIVTHVWILHATGVLLDRVRSSRRKKRVMHVRWRHLLDTSKKM